MTVTAAKAAPPRKRRARWTRNARRAQLLDVANRIVNHDGVTRLTMERLSEAAQISKPVVYSHFRNRSDLLVALLQNYWQENDRTVPTRPRDGQSYESHLREAVGGHFDVVLKGSGAVRHMLHTVIEDPVIEKLRTQREQELIRRWKKLTLSYFKVTPAEAEAMAILYRGALEAATSYVVRHPRQRRGIEEMCVRMAMGVLRASGAQE